VSVVFSFQRIDNVVNEEKVDALTTLSNANGAFFVNFSGWIGKEKHFRLQLTGNEDRIEDFRLKL
jgi:hypothetical protein